MVPLCAAGQAGLLAKAHVPAERSQLQQANVLLALKAAEAAASCLSGSAASVTTDTLISSTEPAALRAAAVVQGSQQGTLDELWRLFCGLQVRQMQPDKTFVCLQATAADLCMRKRHGTRLCGVQEASLVLAVSNGRHVCRCLRCWAIVCCVRSWRD